MQGFCAETGGAITLFTATYLGVPVSTTHTITGAIVGVGAARRTSAVRWGVAGGIVVAWIVTMPMAGLIAALAYFAGGPVFLTMKPVQDAPASSTRRCPTASSGRPGAGAADHLARHPAAG